MLILETELLPAERLCCGGEIGDLNLSLSDKDCESICRSVHRSSINVTTQENNNNVLSRWYRTPDRIHKYNPEAPNKCWRCNDAPGTMLHHIWGTCNTLQPFWTAVHELIKAVTSKELTFSPVKFLLHYSLGRRYAHEKSLTMHMLNAAKLCVSCHWRSTTTPLTREWFRRLNHIEEMEELISIVHDTLSKFTITGFDWICFKESDAYKAIVGPN